jgi:hypothetical protein
LLSTEKYDELQSKRSFVSQIIELKRPSLIYLIIKNATSKFATEKKGLFSALKTMEKIRRKKLLFIGLTMEQKQATNSYNY